MSSWITRCRLQGGEPPGDPAGGREVVKIDQRKAGDDAVATFYLYDKAGNLTDVWQPAVADALNGGAMTRPHWQYTYYDGRGNQLTQVDPKGNTTRFTYDALGHELSRTLPDGQAGGSNAGNETETFTYDQYGNQKTHVDFNGNTTVNTYYTTGVHAGLIQEADYYKYPHVPSGNSPDETVIYGYDSLNRQSSVDDSASGLTTYAYDPITGNVASITSLEGTINYAYNPTTSQEVRMIASHSGTVTDETDYAYDQQGRLTDVYAVVLQGMTYASFAGLDSNGNPSFTGGTPLVTAYAFDPLGNPASETDPDNTKTTYGYDVDNRLTGLTTTNAATGNAIFEETYQLKNNGLRENVTDTRYNTDGSVFSQTEIAWTYDDDQRLQNETLTVVSGGSNTPSPYSDSFKYDLSNNRSEEDIDENNDGTNDATVTYTYNGDDQLKTETRTGDGPYSITDGYDNNGSLTSQVKSGTNPENDSYGYDARNRMISSSTSITDSCGTTTTTNASYGYDDNGVRVSEATSTTVTPVSGSPTTTSSTTYYLNDPQNPTGYAKAVEESATLNGTPSRSYLIGNEIILQSDNTYGALHLMHDGQGSTRALLTSSGSIFASNGVQERYDYGAFGNLLSSAGGQSNAGAAITSWLFGGDGIYDTSTTWTYHLDRFTDGFIFTSGDPSRNSIQDPVSLHRYLLDDANPINRHDPSGNDSLSDQTFGLASEFDLEEGTALGRVNKRLRAGLGQISSSMSLGLIGEFAQGSASSGLISSEGLAEIGAYLYGFVEGLAQGTANALNGLTNLVYESDWSNGLFYNEDPTEHAASVILAQVGITLISFGLAGDAEAAQEASNGCFLAGTPVLLGNGTTEEAINDIQVGQRVATDGGVANSANGKTKAADPNSTKVNPKTWRLITIEAGDWEVQTLEPLRWIRRHHLTNGSSLLLSDVLDLAEMDVPNNLVGRVDLISACMAIAKGRGRVVLTTVSHLNDFVFHLTLDEASGQADTIGITGYHKVYTEDRGWVDADDLRQGEYVETADGEAKVEGLVSDPGIYRVYNMSVEADHVYYVGDAQALVHNVWCDAVNKGHHIDPEYLGGGEDEETIRLSGWVHQYVHQKIDEALKEHFGDAVKGFNRDPEKWFEFFWKDPAKKQEALQIARNVLAEVLRYTGTGL